VLRLLKPSFLSPDTGLGQVDEYLDSINGTTGENGIQEQNGQKLTFSPGSRRLDESFLLSDNMVLPSAFGYDYENGLTT
jgi:hypothetical protein